MQEKESEVVKLTSEVEDLKKQLEAQVQRVREVPGEFLTYLSENSFLIDPSGEMPRLAANFLAGTSTSDSAAVGISVTSRTRYAPSTSQVPPASTGSSNSGGSGTTSGKAVPPLALPGSSSAGSPSSSSKKRSADSIPSSGSKIPRKKSKKAKKTDSGKSIPAVPVPGGVLIQPFSTPTATELGIAPLNTLLEPDVVVLPGEFKKPEDCPKEIYELLRRGIEFSLAKRLVDLGCSLFHLLTEDQTVGLYVFFHHEDPDLMTESWLKKIPKHLQDRAEALILEDSENDSDFPRMRAPILLRSRHRHLGKILALLSVHLLETRSPGVNPVKRRRATTQTQTLLLKMTRLKMKEKVPGMATVTLDAVLLQLPRMMTIPSRSLTTQVKLSVTQVSSWHRRGLLRPPSVFLSQSTKPSWPQNPGKPCSRVERSACGSTGGPSSRLQV